MHRRHETVYDIALRQHISKSVFEQGIEPSASGLQSVVKIRV